MINEAVLISLAHGQTAPDRDDKPILGLKDALAQLASDEEALQLRKDLGIWQKLIAVFLIISYQFFIRYG